MGLAAILLPLLPALIQAVVALINAIEQHPDTPAVTRAHLVMVTQHLDHAAQQARVLAP